MICTENEARTKWCPHTRDTSNDIRDGSAFNRVGGGLVSAKHGDRFRCLASACIHWTPERKPLGKITVPTGRGSCGLGRAEP